MTHYIEDLLHHGKNPEDGRCWNLEDGRCYVQNIACIYYDHACCHQDEDDVSGEANLKHVDLVEGEIHETIAALQLKEWRNDMSEVIDSINQILPTTTTPAGSGWEDDVGEGPGDMRVD